MQDNSLSFCLAGFGLLKTSRVSVAYSTHVCACVFTDLQVVFERNFLFCDFMLLSQVSHAIRISVFHITCGQAAALIANV